MLGQTSKNIPSGLVQKEIIAKLDLKVPEGMYVGKPIVLLPFQEVLIVETLFDKRCRRAIFSFPRKNAKTTLTALIDVLAALGIGGRITNNSLIVAAARSRQQAALIFEAAARMISMSSVLSSIFVIRESKKEIFCLKTHITIRAISAESTTAYGLSPALVSHDELGQVRAEKDDLYEALETASGAHENPLSIVLSTQAPLDSSLLSTLIDNSIAANDPSDKCFLYAADKDDDIYDEAVWFKCNPALGKFRSYKEFKDAAERARRSPSWEMSFRHYYLNQRIDAVNSLISPDTWRLNSQVPDPALLYERDVSLGLDLSSRNDLTAAVMTVEDEEGVFHVFCNFWLPEGNIDNLEKQSKLPYRLWADQGYLTLVPGNSIRYEYVAKWIADVYSEYNLVALNFDRWRMDELKKELEDIGVYIDDIKNPVGQGFKDMSPAIDNLEALVLDGRLRHGDNPILTSCVSNSAVVKDAAGNRKVDKARSVGKIDGCVALIMSLAKVGETQSSGTSPLMLI